MLIKRILQNFYTLLNVMFIFLIIYGRLHQEIELKKHEHMADTILLLLVILELILIVYFFPKMNNFKEKVLLFIYILLFNVLGMAYYLFFYNSKNEIKIISIFSDIFMSFLITVEIEIIVFFFLRINYSHIKVQIIIACLISAIYLFIFLRKIIIDNGIKGRVFWVISMLIQPLLFVSLFYYFIGYKDLDKIKLDIIKE